MAWWPQWGTQPLHPPPAAPTHTHIHTCKNHWSRAHRGVAGLRPNEEAVICPFWCASQGTHCLQSVVFALLPANVQALWGLHLSFLSISTHLLHVSRQGFSSMRTKGYWTRSRGWAWAQQLAEP